MKKMFFAVALLCALCLTGCDVEKMSSLKDISRPYAAEYKCKKLQLGGEDLLGGFDYVKLRLGYGGDYTLFYAGEEGEGEQSGTYELSSDEGKITMHGGGKTYIFPYEKGTVRIQLQFQDRLLLAEFSAAAT